MAVLSRSSLRGPVRRNHNDHRDHDQKRQRTLHDLWPVNRRRSSPDCLDATTPTHDSTAAKGRHAPPVPKPARPRPATRRTRRGSSSSVDSLASGDQLTNPATPRINGSGVTALRRLPDRDTPAANRPRSATDLLRDEPESPDPLDTISPAVTNLVGSRPGAPAHLVDAETLPTSPATARSTRGKDEGIDLVAQETNKSEAKSRTKDATVVQSSDMRTGDATRSQQPQQKQQQQQQHNKQEEGNTEQDASAPTGNERRSLRSKDTGSRCKSELAQYFHNYEQIVSLDEPKPELLSFNTIVSLVDDLPESLPTVQSNPFPFGNPLQKLRNCEVITLPEPASSSAAVDPLNEDLYFRAHRKFERQEKQLRNIERDRAQHEKQHIDRLLDELRGPDWLRVMGLTGVHENEKKLYEPKRKILIDELVALVTKFQVWRDEERKRKLAKEKHLSTADTEADSHGHRSSRKRSRPVEDVEEEEEEVEEEEASPLPETLSSPDPNDVDALAARQLHQEARSASVAKRRKSVSENRKPKAGRADHKPSTAADDKADAKRHKTQHSSTSSLAPPPPAPFVHPPPPETPFTSFFEHSHQREVAMAAANGTRRGRTHNILAFGQPIPDTPERDFHPPEGILTDEAIYASQRQRRLLKRRSRG